MPEITLVHVALLVATALAGAIAAWVARGKQSEREKIIVSAGWQEQVEAKGKENDRLVAQNRNLMEQVAQFQASNHDAKNRAKELSETVREAFDRRDQLQREIKDIRSNLETVLNQRDRLQSTIDAQDADDETLAAKDARIEHLARELRNWQQRLPPLVTRFRERNADAERLEGELESARSRIIELESALEELQGEQTRIEPVQNPEELTAGLDASNDAAGQAADKETDRSAEVEDFEPGPGRRDDLQMIKGVGPAIEKTLNEMGIFNFEQIANMSEYDIDRVARRLKGFRSRIYREDWIGQARDLRHQGTPA